MATNKAIILEFPSRPAAVSSKPTNHADECAEAEIIIFPGVRIERWEDALSSQSQRRPKARAVVNRDTLDLID